MCKIANFAKSMLKNYQFPFWLVFQDEEGSLFVNFISDFLFLGFAFMETAIFTRNSFRNWFWSRNFHMIWAVQFRASNNWCRKLFEKTTFCLLFSWSCGFYDQNSTIALWVSAFILLVSFLAQILGVQRKFKTILGWNMLTAIDELITLSKLYILCGIKEFFWIQSCF